MKTSRSRDENGVSKSEGEENSGLGNNPAEQRTKSSEPPKQDYIHVRARRGQATDSHSLAERVNFLNLLRLRLAGAHLSVQFGDYSKTETFPLSGQERKDQ